MGEKRKSVRGRQWVGLVAGVVALSLSGMVLVKTTKYLLVDEAEAEPVRYLTIVDAGSSGCRAHVFTYRRVQGKVEVDPSHPNLKVKPGLSTFADHPEQAGDSLQGLLDFMREHIPESERSQAPIFLKATAGLRMLTPEKAEAILASVRKVLKASEFAFDDQNGAIIIQGTDEGGFGWLSVNFLMKKIKKETMSVIEMGGASAQVTSLNEIKSKALRGAKRKLPPGYEFSLKLDGNKYSLYAKSYLGYGLEQAREKLNTFLLEQKATSDPCLAKGWKPAKDSTNVYDGVLPGSGDSRQCQDLISQALFPTSVACHYEACSNIQDSYQPPSLTQSPVLAFENFYYTEQMLGLEIKTPKDFSDAAPLVCDATWSELQSSDFPKDGSEKSDLTKICFSALYLPAFLTTGLGLPENKDIRIQQSVGDFGIDWSLGAAIREANLLTQHPS